MKPTFASKGLIKDNITLFVLIVNLSDTFLDEAIGIALITILAK